MILLGQNVGNKTKVRVDDINNPTIVYTGDSVYSNTGIQLDYCPIIELTFSLDKFHKIASGMEIYIIDVDTGKTYFIINETIFSIMQKLISDDYIRKTNDTVTMKFTFSKRGRRYNLELYND